MKAEELMFRDWVHSKLHNVDTQIDCVESGRDSDLNSVWLTSKECGERHYLDEIEPIPLTPEILKKNGFDKKVLDGVMDLYSYKEGRYLVTFFSDNGCPILSIEDIVDNDTYHSVIVLKDEIYNVHQLQHVFRLCGIENEIVI